MKRTIWMLTLAAVALGGCSTARLQTPAGFAAHTDDKTYEYRASDGAGVVIAVRREKNRPQGDLDFWSAALDVNLRQAGYQATERGDVLSADGHTGRQLRYVVPTAGRELTFWVTLFVTQRQVVVVEAGGDSELFEPKAATVQGAIASLEVG
ncbi:MAG: hypothetical protein K0V04_25495 [Deltaproteobacteria bacterium]|nr:hypothetical protein [Deltaproteobacteria bacterium]